jgi:hypothetical protein
MAIDGFDLNVPDSPQNAREFGYAGNDQTRSAFPKDFMTPRVAPCG